MQKPKILTGITAKYLVAFISLTFLSVILTAAISLYFINLVGDYAAESSLKQGRVAAQESADALTVMAEDSISQKSHDIAGQVKIYLDAHPSFTNEAISKDETLKLISVQPLGRTGYTLLYRRDTARMIFHSNPELNGFDMNNWAKTLPAFWGLLESARAGDNVSGYYDWQEADGSIRQKFMAVAPVGNYPYSVCATAYINEFLSPAQRVEDRITNAAQATGIFLERQKFLMQGLFGGIVALMLILSAVIAWYLARTVSKPILALADSSKSISEGNLDPKLSINTGDEIEILAGQFTKMAASLKESHNNLERKVDERTKSERHRIKQLIALNDVGKKINSIMVLDELLPLAARAFQETFNYSIVNIFMLEQDSGEIILKASSSPNASINTRLKSGIAHSVAHTGTSAFVNDKDGVTCCTDLPGTVSELAVPIEIGGGILGTLDIRSSSADAFDSDDVFAAEVMADEIAIAMENARLSTEIRDLAVLEERNRMAREIHDTLAQGFTGIVLQLEAAEQTIKDEKSVRSHLDLARKLARESLDEARRSVWALRPRVLDSASLPDSIKQEITKAKERTSIDIEFTLAGQQRPLPPEIEFGLVRILQESLTNVLRHSGANLVQVFLTYGSDKAEMEIRDNGSGFNPDEIRSGFGLTSMRERARIMGATFSLTSQPGGGASLRVTLPV